MYSIKPFKFPWWQRAFEKGPESAEGSACKKDQSFLGRIGRRAASLEKSRCQCHFRGPWSTESVVFLAGAVLKCSSWRFSTKPNKTKPNKQKASFGWAARERWEGREEADKFRDRTFATGGIWTSAAYRPGERKVGLSQKGCVGLGQGR